MPRQARIHFVSLHSSLVNLPISLYGPLLERGIRPQSLAVHLTHTTATKQAASGNGTKRVEAYVGWTGMASASSLARFSSGDAGDKGLETIEIDPQFAEGLGFSLGDIVEIGLLHDLGFAQSVATEPLTSDDWEIIEIHASHVESTLLSQVRVAVIGQEIDVWVMGRTRVRLRVNSLDPSTSGRALLLNNSTEVSIAPKLHAKERTSASRNARSKPNSNHNREKATKTNDRTDSIRTGHSEKAESAAKTDALKKPTLPLRVLPTQFFTLPTSSAYLSDSESELAIAYVSHATLASLYDTCPSALSSWHASVRRIKPPVDPTEVHTSDGPDSVPVPRVLVPSGETSKTMVPLTHKSLDDEVILVWSADVPVPGGHIVFSTPVDSVQDWNLVRVLCTKEHEVLPSSKDNGSSEILEPRSNAQSKNHLAGIDDLLRKCTQFCLTNFALHAFSRRVRGAPGLLVTGRSGAGKTSFLNVIAKSMQGDSRTYAYIIYVDAAKYTETPVAKVRSLLNFWMVKATWHRPSVLVFDNIDKLMGAELEHADSFRSRHITELFLAIYGPSARSAAPNANGVVLLSAAESQASLHPLLNSSHIFREIVTLKPPGKDARRDILKELVIDRMNSSNLTEDPSSSLNYTALATQTEGYSVTDLKDLVSRAIHRAAIRATAEDSNEDDNSAILTTEDFRSAQVDFVPLSLRDVKLQKSDVEWADIGGLRETKRVLRETLEWPTKYGPIFVQSPLRLRSGLLLYGYPGCGKTLLASAVAKECGLNFISIKGPELLNKYIGASEKSVRDLFERASAAKPCVLFFDEFDSIAPKRGHDSTGVTDRVVNQMLTQMDGAEGLDGVYVLAATSRPDLIDSALLRPGRLDKSLLCDMPDEQDRKEILAALSRKITFASSVDLDQIAQDTEGFSGADLQALVYNAHLEVIHDTISSHATKKGQPHLNGTNESPVDREPEDLRYTVLGGDNTTRKVLSRADEAALQRRLQRILSKPTASKSGSGRNQGVDPPPKHEVSQEHLHRVLGTTRPSVPQEERLRLRHMCVAVFRSQKTPLTISRPDTELSYQIGAENFLSPRKEVM
ncbi:uncharacterized protein FIBRA_00464 [Fibroporia radiculosa]|uniref:Peroxisomal ATPase PEX1 n=1 Tax=Fibroporia radiculosa TaxID=599839 RepID=J4I7Y4_9APHY|nr:uncharacterized protein FIBRA_00464 [Fibroporia radiculosa]CCL98466.1 predicted protein [Fibroporia radiculosa]